MRNPHLKLREHIRIDDALSHCGRQFPHDRRLILLIRAARDELLVHQLRKGNRLLIRGECTARRGVQRADSLNHLRIGRPGILRGCEQHPLKLVRGLQTVVHLRNICVRPRRLVCKLRSFLDNPPDLFRIFF